MTPASEIKEGVEQALRDVLDDDDFLRDMFALVILHALLVSPTVGMTHNQAISNVYSLADQAIAARKERWKNKKKG